MKELEKNKIGIIFAIILGGWHVLWSVLVITGLGQLLLDFVFWMHMLTPVYHVTAFTFTQAVTLVIVTTGVGYVVGWTFAWVWNTLHKK